MMNRKLDGSLKDVAVEALEIDLDIGCCYVLMLDHDT